LYTLAGFLGSQGIPLGGLGFHRKKKEGDFTDREKKIIGIIIPYISNALQNQKMMECITSANETGVIVVGIKGETLTFLHLIYLQSRKRSPYLLYRGFLIMKLQREFLSQNRQSRIICMIFSIKQGYIKGLNLLQRC
jgi:hypothetical protein